MQWLSVNLNSPTRQEMFQWFRERIGECARSGSAIVYSCPFFTSAGLFDKECLGDGEGIEMKASGEKELCPACGSLLVENAGRCAACDVLIDHDVPKQFTGSRVLISLGGGLVVLIGVFVLLLQ